jgi:nucleoprotein TPR
LQTDFRAVQKERAKLQQLIDNLNSVSAESEKTRAEERQRMEKRVEEVQREM